MQACFAAGFEQFDQINYRDESYFLELKQITEDLIHREK
jgi:geranylgeranyl diphosphate synthase type II